MGPGDLPKPDAVPKQADIQRVNSEASGMTDPLRENGRAALFDYGLVREMTLPAGWIAGVQLERNEERQHSYKAFHLNDNSDVQIWYFYRGNKISSADAATFKQILSGPEHMLTPAELRSVASVIRDKSNADDFKIMAAKTEQLNGKKVLLIEGRYAQSQDDSTSLYFDAGSDGAIVQELHYRAPKAQYMRYLKNARDSFNTIVWN